MNGLNGLALTKLDVVRGRGAVRVCVGYRLGGVELDEPPPDGEDLVRAEPQYVEVEGWDADIGAARAIEDLPPPARSYIATIERLIGAPMWVVSVGPGREETILLRDPFTPLGGV